MKGLNISHTMFVKSDAVIALESRLKSEYSSLPRNEEERMMDAIENFIDRVKVPGQTLTGILNEAARTVHRAFGFKEIAIGLKDKKDSIYKYVTLFGFNSSAENFRKNLTYTHADMYDETDYPGTWVSKWTQIMMAEDISYRPEEVGTFNRPGILSQKRVKADDFIEGDYIDVYMYGHIGDLIGWIEISGPRAGKLPARETIKWLELFGSLLAAIILQRRAQKT